MINNQSSTKTMNSACAACGKHLSFCTCWALGYAQPDYTLDRTIQPTTEQIIEANK